MKAIAVLTMVFLPGTFVAVGNLEGMCLTGTNVTSELFRNATSQLASWHGPGS